MIVETLTANAAAIYFETEELPPDTGRGQLCALVRRAQSARGLPVWKSMDARMFVNGMRALLLAWPTELSAFRFRDFETLLRAVRGCPEELSSALMFLENEWVLLLRCPVGRVPLALCEFSVCEPVSEAFAAHIAEHGELIFVSDAAAQLCARFPA